MSKTKFEQTAFAMLVALSVLGGAVACGDTSSSDEGVCDEAACMNCLDNCCVELGYC